MNFNLVVIPPELKTGHFLNTQDALEAHYKLISMACWKPHRFKTKWPWGIAGACECPERHEKYDGSRTILLPPEPEGQKFVIRNINNDEVVNIDERI